MSEEQAKKELEELKKMVEKDRERLEKQVEKLREELEWQMNETLTTVCNLDSALPKNVILDIEEMIKRARKFLKAYERTFPLPEEEGGQQKP